MKHLTYFLVHCEYGMISNDHQLLHYHNFIFAQYKSEIFFVVDNFGKYPVFVVKMSIFLFVKSLLSL